MWKEEHDFLLRVSGTTTPLFRDQATGPRAYENTVAQRRRRPKITATTTVPPHQQHNSSSNNKYNSVEDNISNSNISSPPTDPSPFILSKQ
jgi:hypothetical protein